jgi:hypothetical protein
MPEPAARLTGLASALMLLAPAGPWHPLGPILAAPKAAEPDVCVLTPRVEPDRDGLARAVVPVSVPTIFVRNPLTQVRILRDTRPLWQLQASGKDPIEGPIFWPLPRLRPGEILTLQLQPMGAAGDAFASIELQAAGAAVLARNDLLLAGLGDDPARWQAAVNRARQEKDLALTSALLFAYEGPSGDDLNALRLLVIERSCGAP